MAPLYGMSSSPTGHTNESDLGERRQINIFSSAPPESINDIETAYSFHSLGKVKGRYVFITPTPVVQQCDSYNTQFKYQVGMGPGDLTELSPTRSRTTWLTDPQQIYLFTEVFPLLAGIFVFTFFLMVALVLIYGLTRHFYLDHVLPTIYFTLKPLRKDKTKVLYLKFPDGVAFQNLGFYRWNPIRKCYRRHSVCQLHHNHRNHRRLSDHEKPNDKLSMQRVIKATSESRTLSSLNVAMELKPAIAISKFMLRRKRKIKPLKWNQGEEEAQKPSKETESEIQKHDETKTQIHDEHESPKQPKKRTGERKKSIIEDALKKESSLRYQQQQFPSAEVMMSVNDINISAFVPPKSQHKRKRKSTAPKLTVPRKDLGKSPKVSLQPDNAKADPAPPLPTSNIKRKRKSSTPGGPGTNLVKTVTPSLPHQETTNEPVVRKKLIRRRKIIAPVGSALTQGKIQMKTLRRPPTPGPDVANVENSQNEQKNDSDKDNFKRN